MEYALWLGDSGQIEPIESSVLILVLMEYALWQCLMKSIKEACVLS